MIDTINGSGDDDTDVGFSRLERIAASWVESPVEMANTGRQEDSTGGERCPLPRATKNPARFPCFRRWQRNCVRERTDKLLTVARSGRGVPVAVLPIARGIPRSHGTACLAPKWPKEPEDAKSTHDQRQG